MLNAQKNEINAKKIGYMSYNKLNVFMSTLLVGFSITFAILGDRVNISGWDGNAIGWGIFWVVVVAVVLAVINKFGTVIGDAIINNSTINDAKIYKTIIGISSLVCIIIILAIFVSPWWWFSFCLFLIPVLYHYGYKENPIILAAIISIISIGGIGHLLFPLIGALILDAILGFILFYIGYKNLTEIHQIKLQFGISLSAFLIGLLGVLGILLFN